MVLVEQCWHKSLSPLMEEVRKEFKDVPTYISFDIDAIDPCFCPGTGKSVSEEREGVGERGGRELEIFINL